MTTVPTWRALWHRLINVLRLRRVTFRYCADCGTTLTPDETVTCAECIERNQARWRDTTGTIWQTVTQLQNMAYASHPLAALANDPRAMSGLYSGAALAPMTGKELLAMRRSGHVSALGSVLGGAGGLLSQYLGGGQFGGPS